MHYFHSVLLVAALVLMTGCAKPDPQTAPVKGAVIFQGVPLAGGLIKDATGSLTGAFFLSAGLLAVGVLVSRILTRPASSAH